MIFSVNVRDNFCEHAGAVRASALEAGFGTWRPATKGAVGSSVYDGMGFQGAHGVMLRSLSQALGGLPVFPNSMFFRVTTRNTERAYIHSDRKMGSWTCVAYLSDHGQDMSGTAFWRHRRTGMLEMPSLEVLAEANVLDQLSREMVEGSPDVWEQTDFVRGLFNRAVIFHAPLFHSRIPMDGIGEGDDPEKARLVWVSHFDL